jgi:putative transcriptional regulator
MIELGIGVLLVAATRLIDPNFARTVILVCAHGDDGAVGLVLNRSSDVAVGDHLPGWVEQLAPPDVVFFGGPVQPETAIGLARLRPEEPPPDRWEPVAGSIGLLDLAASPGLLTGALAALRVFGGYAGWSAGQLEGEIGRGDWHIVELGDDDPFTSEPAGLWRRVLKRQPGPIAWYADYPPNPSLN